MKRATVVVGLGFGDEGKGKIVEAYTKKHGATLNVRFNGGAQAAHHVVLSDGRSHCFSQWGSGTFQGAKTHLSEHVVIDPLAMEREAARLEELGVQKPFELLSVHPEAIVTTPYHVALNQLLERHRGDKSHGSCGRGIGAAWSLKINQNVALKARYWESRDILVYALARVRNACAEEAAKIGVDVEFNDITPNVADLGERLHACQFITLDNAEATKGHDVLVFEGAQGMLLGEEIGFFPHITRGFTSDRNAIGVLKDVKFSGAVKTVGVTRTYSTRHGNGPFPAGAFSVVLPEHKVEHNQHSRFQGAFRVGPFDRDMFMFATAGLQPDALAITHCDTDTGLYTVDSIDSNRAYREAIRLAPRGSALAPEERLRYSEWLGKHCLSNGKLQSCRRVVDWLLSNRCVWTEIASYGPTVEDNEWF